MQQAKRVMVSTACLAGTCLHQRAKGQSWTRPLASSGEQIIMVCKVPTKMSSVNGGIAAWGAALMALGLEVSRSNRSEGSSAWLLGLGRVGRGGIGDELFDLQALYR